MNKQEKIKQKTWEYFKQQKKEEICGFFDMLFWFTLILILIFSVASSIAYSVALITNDLVSFGNYEIFLRINFLINIIGWPCFGIYKWLSSNWKKAKEKAEREVDSQ